MLQLARANAAANLSPTEQGLLEYKELKWEAREKLCQYLYVCTSKVSKASKLSTSRRAQLAADSAWQYMPKPDVILGLLLVKRSSKKLI